MEKPTTVTVNGRLYDQATGLPIDGSTASPSAPETIKAGVKDFAEVAVKVTPSKERVATAATTVHSAPQRSQTLNRRVAAKNMPAKRPTKTGHTMDIARSSKIARFAPHPTDAHAQQPAEPADHPPVSHPMVTRATKHIATAATPPSPTLSSKEIKKKAIDKALAAPSPSKKPVKKGGFWIRHLRLWVILASILVVSGVASYAILVNLPTISVSIADSQAGISATYPTYTPNGFALQQPVNYSDGQVTLKFVNTGDKNQGYTIVQKGSSWDSSAVLQNIVIPTAGPNYATIQDSGLTIYTYGHAASWVNNSILYTITTTAPLSNEQIRDIATSL